jgi:hypothetical protein
MQRIAVFDPHCRAEFQITGHVTQVGHALTAYTALAVVFIFVQAMALQARIESFHHGLPDVQALKMVADLIRMAE